MCNIVFDAQNHRFSLISGSNDNVSRKYKSGVFWIVLGIRYYAPNFDMVLHHQPLCFAM